MGELARGSTRLPGDKSTGTQLDPAHAPHAYVRPGDGEKRGCVKCGRLPDASVHQGGNRAQRRGNRTGRPWDAKVPDG